MEGINMSNIVAVDNKMSAIDLAMYFILKENMSQKKVQKLAYYAQAYSLVINNSDIVEGIEFQAWVHGPVNTELRKRFREYGWRDMMIIPEQVDNVKSTLNELISNEQKSILELVWSAYGDLSADELEQLTHSEDPWLEKREGLEDFERSAEVISNETMRNYYRQFYNA